MEADITARPGDSRSFIPLLVNCDRRLAPGFSRQSAQDEMDVLAREIAQAHRDTNKDWVVKIEPIQEAQFGYWKPILYLLFGVVRPAAIFIVCQCIHSWRMATHKTKPIDSSIASCLGENLIVDI